MPKSTYDFSSARRRLISTFSAVSVLGFVLGISMTVVTPPWTAASEPVRQSSLYSRPGSRKWTWPSMTPGQHVLAGGVDFLGRLEPEVAGCGDGHELAVVDREVGRERGVGGDDGPVLDDQIDAIGHGPAPPGC